MLSYYPWLRDVVTDRGLGKSLNVELTKFNRKLLETSLSIGEMPVYLRTYIS